MGRKCKFVILVATIIIMAIACLIYRGTGTGYVESVTGVSIPWLREQADHFDCDFGQYSIFRLHNESMEAFLAAYPWKKHAPIARYEGDSFMFRSLPGAQPLPDRDDLLWLDGVRRFESWTMYLHVPTRRLLVAVEHPDNAGDLPERATEHHKDGEQVGGCDGEKPRS